jgi:integrase
VSGHLDQLRPGIWRFRKYLVKMADGKQKQRSKTFPAPTLKAADRIATAISKEWDDESAKIAGHRGTVHELVAEWLEFRTERDSPTTLYRVQSICAAIQVSLGHIKATELTPLDIDRWYTSLAKRKLKPLTPTTIRHYHRVLHAVLRQSRKWRKITWNPAEDATPPTVVPPTGHDMPTPEAVRAMLSGASRSVRMACTLAAVTGARRGELVGLLWSDIDGNQLTIQRSLIKVPGQPVIVGPTKTKKSRTITLDNDTLLALAAHRIEAEGIAAVTSARLAGDGPILAHMRKDPTGRTPYPPDWLSQEWERLRLRHGVTANLHSLRHFHATQLIDRGVAISTVSARLGHSQISTTTDIYTWALKQSDDLAAVVISDVLRGTATVTS